jgi:hypothetical protein
MILRVPLDKFAEIVKARLGRCEAFLSQLGERIRVTAGDESKGLVVEAVTAGKGSLVKAKLAKAGLEVLEGEWIVEGSVEPAQGVQGAHIGAVAYRSGESTPGLWVEAFAQAPTRAQVLQALFDEFRRTGELPDVPFDQFVRHAQPNVVVLTPGDIKALLDAQRECE